MAGAVPWVGVPASPRPWAQQLSGVHYQGSWVSLRWGLCPAHPSGLEGEAEDGVSDAFPRRGPLCWAHVNMAFEPHQEPYR